MEWLSSYFQSLSFIEQGVTVIIMSVVGFIILVLTIKRWLINR